MAFRKGSSVTIVKKLGSENEDDPGDKDTYYFGGYGDDIPLKTKGKITRMNGNKIYVEFDDISYPFHRNELAFENKEEYLSSLGKIPQNYLFKLASEIPVFIFNDRLYYLSSEPKDDLDSNYFQTSKERKIRRYSLIESASLSSLEKLTLQHNKGILFKIKEKYIKEVLDDESYSEAKDANYRLVDFIVNRVFPYFRNNQSTSKIAGVLGFNVMGKNENTDVSKNGESNKFISDLIEKVAKEKFKEDDKKSSKFYQKVDSILAREFDFKDFITNTEDYQANSLLGRILGGRNVAIIDNKVYYLRINNNQNTNDIVNFDGKDFICSDSKPISDTVKEFEFELMKQIRIDALKSILNRDNVSKKVFIQKIVKMKAYGEDDFGFLVDDDNYYVFLDVPKHVLKDPEHNKYYLFGNVKIGVSIGDSGQMYENKVVILQNYSHPFVGYSEDKFEEICVGNYPYSKLSNLKKEEAIARLLIDAKNTLLSGYNSKHVSPMAHLGDFESKRISLAEIKRRKLNITNINLGKSTRKR